MKRLILFATLTGCSHSQMERGLDLGHKGLAVIDVGATHAGDLLRTGTQAAADTCRALWPDADKVQRDACMHKARLAPADLEQAQAALEAIAEAYGAIARALDLIEAVYPKVLPALEAAKEAMP